MRWARDISPFSVFPVRCVGVEKNRICCFLMAAVQVFDTNLLLMRYTDGSQCGLACRKPWFALPCQLYLQHFVGLDKVFPQILELENICLSLMSLVCYIFCLFLVKCCWCRRGKWLQNELVWCRRKHYFTDGDIPKSPHCEEIQSVRKTLFGWWKNILFSLSGSAKYQSFSLRIRARQVL